MIWLIIVAVLVGVAIVALALPRMQSERLRRQFGPEYERVLEREGDRRRAESVLRDRRSRFAALELRDLDYGVATAYRKRWQEVQLSFVDDPSGAVAEGHELVREVMRERGYPANGFEERFEMISVERADLAEQYRAASALEAESEAGRADLDDQRSVFQAYRTLFAYMLGDAADPSRAKQADDDVPDNDVTEDDRVEGGTR